MAGTTRLELATSAVTGGNNKYLQLTRLLGTAKYLKIRRSGKDLGLAFGLESSKEFDGGTQVKNRETM
jgi:hypothetical protein